ncbi:hypothetical protein [Azorhizobium caulinodans]|uniref:hypothetical protein n=1 Tax=Azorhizobium caulinodans TaxID=7 RepID=UPI002FBE3D89
MTFFASSDRAGVIRITPTLPAGVLVIADDPSEDLLAETISALARHSYDGKTLLVPGIPEAPSDMAALEALISFRARVMHTLAQVVS